MKMSIRLLQAVSALALSAVALTAWAQNPAAPTEGTWVVKDFRFNTGEILPELKLHYTTLGDPKNEAVLVLHGTRGSLTPPGNGVRSTFRIIATSTQIAFSLILDQSLLVRANEHHNTPEVPPSRLTLVPVT